MALLRKEDVQQPKASPPLGALLGVESRFEGRLSFEGTVQIDGVFVGEVVSDGTLIIGETAHLEGAINVGEAVVSGTVSGDIRVHGTLELRATGRMTGDLVVGTLITERGAFLDGTVKMQSDATDASSAQPVEGL